MKRGRTRTPTSHAAALPAHTVVYAVGDVHGRLDLLEGAIAEIERGAEQATASGDHVTAIFLGDYIDRGPAAKGVIDRLIALQKAKPCEMVFLRGNHEQFLLDMIDDRARGTAWLDYGGIETLRSYGVDASAISARELERLGEALRKALPAEHVRFLRDTRLSDERGDYLFVHAGLRPDRLLSEQSDADMLWFRYYGDDEPVHGKTVVHGHTPHDRPLLGRWRINVDTGAYDSGELTALRLEGEDARFLKIDLAPGGGSPRVSDWGRSVERAYVAPPTAAARMPQPAEAPRAPAPPRAVPWAMGRKTRVGLMAAGALAVATVLVAVVLAGMAWLFQTRPGTTAPPEAALAAPPPVADAAAAQSAPPTALAAANAPTEHLAKAPTSSSAANAVVPTEVAAAPPPVTIAAPPPAAVAVETPPPQPPAANADAPIYHAPPADEAPTAGPPPSPSQ